MPERWFSKAARVSAPLAARRYGIRRSMSQLLRWSVVIALLGVATGSAVALFLWSLDEATRLRVDHPWLLYLLPLGGMAVVLMYRAGGESERGNNLIITALHEPTSTSIPGRMGPLVLVATVVTHLFGGSAGREGTAVQIGGSFAGGLNRYLRLTPGDFRILVMAGMAAGFGSVFGTPIAGAIFAIEVATVGRLEYQAFGPALAAAFIADYTTSAWGIGHTHYAIAGLARTDGGLPYSLLVAGKVALAGVAFGLASVLFAESVHFVARMMRRFVRWPLLKPVAGALAVILLVQVVGSEDYLGLGVSNPDPAATSIVSSFEEDGASPFGWLWKTVFTAVTLGTGFKGGEVTPLFFVGATLGNALSGILEAPVDLLAGAGFVAVFGAAANTPLASTVMGIELFGAGHAVYLAIACFVARAVSGRGGIYLAQRFHQPESRAVDDIPEGRDPPH